VSPARPNENNLFGRFVLEKKHATAAPMRHRRANVGPPPIDRVKTAGSGVSGSSKITAFSFIDNVKAGNGRSLRLVSVPRGSTDALVRRGKQCRCLPLESSVRGEKPLL